jgi:hypothetical protein
MGSRRPLDFALLYAHALAVVKDAGKSAQDLLPGGWPRANEHRRPMWSFGP